MCGYDAEGYYYTHIGTCEARGPVAWGKLGTIALPMLEVYSVELCTPAAEDKVVRDALRMALRHAQDPGDWIDPDARSGVAAFEFWAEHLDAGEALLLHHDWNLQVWLDCREAAIEFLTEAESRLPGKAGNAFESALRHYRVVAASLRKARGLVPKKQTTWEERLKFASPEAAQLIRDAGDAERQALDCLERIVAAL